MRDTWLRLRFAFFAPAAGAFACAFALAACGSSGQTSTTPTTLSKCAVTFNPSASNIPATGGAGSVAVTTERECQWTATSGASWLSITSGGSGQGPGTIQFTAAANIDPVARTAALVVNDAQVQVTEAAGQCSFQLAQPSGSFPQAGGHGSVDVSASSALCSWTATSDANWITITSGASGKGSASVAFTVAPTTGPPRTSTLTIAGLPFSVTQSAGCTYDVSPLSVTVNPAGGAPTVTVGTSAGCPWTAVAHDAWITVTAGASGTGPGSVALAIAPTTGPARSGTLTVAGQTVTIVESPGCTFSISPSSHNSPSGGDTVSIAVAAGAGCSWSAESNVSWIAVSSGQNGSGNGTVQLAVAPNTGPERTAAVTIATQTFTIVQAGGCSATVSPETIAQPAAAATQNVTVTTGAACMWTAVSNVPWMTIPNTTSGTGNGTVPLAIAANVGPPRSGTATIAGRTVTVNQSSGCTFAIAPSSITVGQAGGTGSVSVKANGGCAWTASSRAPWITLTSGATGTGDGSVQFKVDANAAGPARSGTITIAGDVFTVNQAGR